MNAKGLGLGLALLSACGGQVGSGATGTGGAGGVGSTGGTAATGGMGATGATGGTGGTSVTSGGGTGGSSTSCILGTSGTYLWVAATSLDFTKPLVFLVDVKLTSASGAQTMTWTLQPLLWSDRKTPVGTPTTWPAIPLAADGTFFFDPPAVDVPGEANPFSHTPLTVDLSALKGSFCIQGSFACGTMDGEVTKPIPLTLDGSSWTATPLTGAIPEPPPIDCKGTPALPLGGWG